MLPPVLKKQPSKKERLMHELRALEQELLEYGSNVSESQVWHKKAKIENIKKQIAEIDREKAKSFGAATDKIKSEMAQKDMAAFNMSNVEVRE